MNIEWDSGAMIGENGGIARKSVVLIFDEFFGSRDNLVGSYLNLLVKQLVDINNFVCLTKEPYRGPAIVAAGRKIHFINAKEPLSSKVNVWQLFNNVYNFEPHSFWATNLSGDFKVIARLMFNVESYHAIVCFTQTAGFALAVARLAHIFSSSRVPHLFAVTRSEDISDIDTEDLKWLNVKLLIDGELVPSVDLPNKPQDAYLFVRPFSAMARRELGKIARNWIARKFKLRSSVEFTHFSGVLRHIQNQRTKVQEGAKGNGKNKEFLAHSFFDDEVFPLRARRANTQIDWKLLAGSKTEYPHRIRNVVLFVRPDWDASGSSTSFNSFKSYFRQNESLCIEIAIWPYFVPFSRNDRWNKMVDSEKNGRTAASFFLRRSAGIASHIRAFLARLRLQPRTLSGELPLYYVASATPPFMAECIKKAKFNMVFVNHYFTLEFIAPFIKGRRFYLDTHDIQSTNTIHQMYRNPITTRLDSFDDLLNEELHYLRRADRLSFVSPAELAMVNGKLPPERLKYFIPLPVVKPTRARKLSRKPKLAFIASNNLANEQGTAWFLNEVWPLVLSRASRAVLAGLQMQIVGDIKQRFADVEVDRLVFTGRVDSIEQVYSESDLIILPVVSGGGVAIKTIEAILHHKAIVGTRHSLRGLPDGVEESLCPKDGAEDFATCIVELISNGTLLEKQRKRSVAAAKRLLAERFYERLADSLEAIRLPDDATL